MIQNATIWEAWEREFLARERPDYLRNLKIYEAMYEEARRFGVLPGPDPLAGLDDKICLAAKL